MKPDSSAPKPVKSSQAVFTLYTPPAEKITEIDHVSINNFKHSEVIDINQQADITSVCPLHIYQNISHIQQEPKHLSAAVVFSLAAQFMNNKSGQHLLDLLQKNKIENT